MTVSTSLQKKLEELQIKIMEHSVEEARLKKEKAKTELETARLQQGYTQMLFEKECSIGGDQ